VALVRAMDVVAVLRSEEFGCDEFDFAFGDKLNAQLWHATERLAMCIAELEAGAGD
ncbi:unnamed protein product, partial [Effrenium voratum]